MACRGVHFAITPEQTRRLVAAALEPVTRDRFRQRCFSLLKRDEYDGTIDEDDFEYTWEHFTAVRDLYRAAAAGGRAVVFTVDA